MFAYADLGDLFAVGVDLTSWALPLHIQITRDYAYGSIEIRALCFYFNARWIPSEAV
jgi:hypothetical protein